MDPFSLAVGIAGLAGLAAATAQLVMDYHSSLKGAKDSVLVLATELKALESNLSRLDGFLRSLATNQITFQHTSALRSCTSACEAKLKALCTKLDKLGESRLDRYLWPLKEAEHEKSVQEFRAFAQWIQFALTVDGCSLLSQTSANVLQILEKQAKSFRMLRTIEDEMAELHDAVRDQSLMLQEDHRMHQEEAKKRVLNWVSRLDQNRKHHSVRSPRVESTGGWLLREPDYVRWRDDLTASNVLWCHGEPGTGKSVLTSVVIDDLKSSPSSESSLVFFYFDYQDRENQTLDNVLSSMLKQIVAVMPEIPKSVNEIYAKGEISGEHPSAGEIEDMLVKLTESMSVIYVVIDALDECDDLKYRKKFLEFFGRLKQNKSVRLFVASRPHIQDINGLLEQYPQIVVRADTSDLRSYVEHELSYNADKDVVSEALARTITEKVLENAHGSARNVVTSKKQAQIFRFILPILQLRSILKEPTPGAMKDALRSMSANFGEAFEQTFSRIRKLPDGFRRIGIDALMWISHSKRAMTISELRDATSLRLGQVAMDEDYRPSLKKIIEYCQGLATVDQETSTVRLHKGFQEYLIEYGDNLFDDAEANIACICMTYLLFDTFRDGPLDDSDDIEARIQANPFLSYASRYCGEHIKLSQNNEMVQNLTVKFLANRNAVGCANQIMQFNEDLREEYWDPDECNSINALHVACRFGMEVIVEKLLSTQAFPIDVLSLMGSTPLILAAAGGHASLVNLLLQRGADPYLENWYGNALHCAAEAGTSDAISVLVKAGMDPIASEQYSRSPLTCTIDRDQVSAFETLVTLGGNVEVVNDCRVVSGEFTYTEDPDLSPFHLAVDNACLDIVDLILENGWSDVNTRSRKGLTALHFAARIPNNRLLQRLLDAGADVDAKDDRGKTPLDIAIEWQHNKNIRMLDRDASLFIP